MDELEQVVVHVILVRRRDAMRRARVVDLLCARYQASRLFRGDRERNDLIILSVKEQRRDVELLQVTGEVRLRERRDALVGVLEADLQHWSQNCSVTLCETRAFGRLRP